MPVSPVSNVWVRVDASRAAEMLGAAAAKLNEAGAEAILDFSALKRIDAGALKALEKLADAADSKGVKLALAGVGVDVYKALKVMKIARRFSVLH